MIETIKEWTSTPWIAFGVYWLPLVVCAVGYTIRTFKNYRTDIACRAENKWYSPTDTVGTLIGRGIVSVIPLANLLAAAFDVAPDMLKGFFSKLERIFSQPLVPKKKTVEGGDK